ncbi:MAG: hypothetical protein Q7K42_03505 [Candidatus Diapherotrites archaeon]|nr:hypothetical protein [Candidatus Diapherotrites archaeon]
MLRLNSEKTYEVIYFILNNRRFSQLEVSKKLGVSFGRVNKIVQWLEKQKFVSRVKRRYVLDTPVALIQLLSKYVELDFVSFEIDFPRKELVKELKKEGVVFCLTSALEEFDSYFREIEINIYKPNENILEKLKNSKKGLTKVNVFTSNISLKENIIKKNGKTVTTEIRTLIDLFSSNKAYAGEILIKKVFK